MKIFTSADQLIGSTPLLELCNIERKLGLKTKILAKLEYLNPAGSVKDRVAKGMIEDAERRGILKKGSTIIEPTSGNTGIGLASVAAAKGYKTIIVMPDTMSRERIQAISAYGADVVLSDGKLGMAGAVKKAEELKNELPDSFIPGQFENPVNPRTHYDTTGAEILADTDGKLDLFVCGVGTGGTISGTGKRLKEHGVRIIAVEPESSPLLSRGIAGAHAIQGIGANFIPEALDKTVYDEILTVSDEDSYKYTKMIATNEGILVGISSGAALAAAVKLSEIPENAGKTVVVLFPDSGDRYYSTGVFDAEP